MELVKMINPNNKEPVEPKLFNGNPNYGTLDLTDSEIERLNKSIETKAANLEYLKQNYPSPIPNHKYLVKGIESQPDSIPNQSKPIVDSVIEELLKRKQLGIERYGVALQSGNGRDALRDAFEEQIDNLLYLKQYMIEKNEMAQQLESLNAIIAGLTFQEKIEALKIIDSLMQFLAK